MVDDDGRIIETWNLDPAKNGINIELQRRGEDYLEKNY